MSSLYGYPGHDLLLPEIIRAEGCRIHDAAGRSWLDLESGVWCAALGHAHPRILAAMAEQAARYGHAGFNYGAAVVEEAAREILDRLGLAGGRCVLLCSGSEAIEYGVRVAQAVAPRPRFLTLADSYFGAYGSAARRQPDEWAAFDWFGCAGCPESRRCDASCERWATIPLPEIGAVLLEPGSSSGLVRFPPAKLVSALVAAVRAAGGLVLVNEVTTGVGRTGRWFGFDHYGIRPDVVALGKGLGNGYPVSAAAFAPGVAERLAARLGGQPIRYAQSHQNDPLGAAVAREVLRTIAAEGLIERGAAMGDLLLAGLREVAAGGGIREVRGRGLMIAIELEDGPDLAATIRAQRELLRRGYVVGRRPGVNVLRLDPPLVVGREDVAGFLAAMAEVLSTRPAAAGPQR